MKTPLSSFGLMAFLILAAGKAAAAPHNVVPLDPPKVNVPAGLTMKQVHKAVYMAAVVRDWRVTEDNVQGHYIDAEYPIRVHVARVRIDYSSTPVKFLYRKSDNLDHGWKKTGVKDKSDAMDRIAGAPAGGNWYLSDTPEGTTGVEMVHIKYNIWLDELGRTLQGTLGLATLD